MKGQYSTTSVRAIIRDDKSILVEWFAPKGICFLPGGHVEANEDLMLALERELAEEISGLTFKVGKYRGSIGHTWSVDDGTDSCLNHFFEVAVTQISEIKAKEEGREMRWISLEDSTANALRPRSLLKLLKDSSTLYKWDEVDTES